MSQGTTKTANFGIRIENVVTVKEVKTKHNFGDKPYFGFDHVTMVPMCRKLIDVSLLSEREEKWLNEYHKESNGEDWWVLQRRSENEGMVREGMCTLLR